MRKLTKKYKAPKRLWDKTRIEKEREIMKQFGLRKKREIWITESFIRKYRRLARELAAKNDKEKEATLIGKLVRLGLLPQGATIDDVLGLTIDNLLNRRLETVVYKKGLANTPKHARQLIVHGHVKISGKRVIFPSYVVPVEEETAIQVNKVGKQ